MNPLFAYGASFAVTFLAGWLGSIASIQARSFYESLDKPAWAPPAGVFGPVWTLLYLSMAIAAGMAINSAGMIRGAAVLFVIQLMLNALWSWTFFKWESGPASMVTIFALWILIIATMIGFWRINTISGAFMIPYLAWVTFASVLNGTIWKLNPGAL